MFLVNAEPTYSKDSNILCRVIIQADETPETFPADGGGVDGMADEMLIDRGSILYDVSAGKRYFMDENREYWIEYGTGTTEPAVPTDDSEETPGE